MPRRNDLSSILIIGSGPIVIGQACEFDYSGTQACRVLKDEGYRVILANSNPATIMTDPDFADRTYIEPLTPEVLESIIERERPDAVLPTLGGQTGLNLAMELFRRGKVGVPGTPELIGANAEAIETAENRERFKEAMIEIGLSVPRSGIAHDMAEARRVADEIGLPVIIRPAYILGGRGTGIANSKEEFEHVAANGLAASPISEILIESSIVGWKEYELEVMRDRADNCVIICSIENLDAMGVHTGDSITIAPIQTLSDVEYQKMRDAAFACIRRVGVETGGSNVQFAVNPQTGEQVVIEMNPRVSRSSALASKATGFPIAKIAAKLAVGYTLDEIPNDITRKTPASFEPTIDYVVTKIPRWAFEKLPGTSGVLGTQMQSVGEVMAIGRTFTESVQKGLRSLEQGRLGLNADAGEANYAAIGDSELLDRCAIPTPERIFLVGEAIRRGLSMEDIRAKCLYDPWFLDQFLAIIEERHAIESNRGANPRDLPKALWRRAKRHGFSDGQIAHLIGSTEREVRAARLGTGVRATFKTVDTCSAEFEASTPYHYSSYEDENEVRDSPRQRVIILGSGPNRIGQGIEFDYCCVHASFALRDAGFETVMVNCNPETVSTDYDTSDRLYFEPLTYEDVMNVIEAETAASGGNEPKLIVTLGGQTPLKLASQLPAHLIAGTSPNSIDLAEDRERFAALVNRLGLKQPENGIARSREEAVAVAARIGYPVLTRPSYVLGGRAMEIVDDQAQLENYIETAVQVSGDSPVLIDRYLRDAIEVDVDALCDGTDVVVAGVLQHIEEAGVHSGDSACSIPPYSLPADIVAEIERQTDALARALNVRGLMNVQYAVKDGEVYLIEVNPRASRTVPFVAKAVGSPIAKIAARVMAGEKLVDLPKINRDIDHVAVKEAVFPFARFPGTDPVLSPEMKSTGEVMGIDSDFNLAFAKAQLGAGDRLPTDGRLFVSVKDSDKPRIVASVKQLAAWGWQVIATGGTADYLAGQGIDVERVNKVAEGRPHIVDRIKDGDVQLIFNTTEGWQSLQDSQSIRASALAADVAYYTTAAGSDAATHAIGALRSHSLEVKPLQDYY